MPDTFRFRFRFRFRFLARAVNDLGQDLNRAEENVNTEKHYKPDLDIANDLLVLFLFRLSGCFCFFLAE